MNCLCNNLVTSVKTQALLPKKKKKKKEKRPTSPFLLLLWSLSVLFSALAYILKSLVSCKLTWNYHLKFLNTLCLSDIQWFLDFSIQGNTRDVNVSKMAWFIEEVWKNWAKRDQEREVWDSTLNYRANWKRKLVFNKTWLRTDIKTILPARSCEKM